MLAAANKYQPTGLLVNNNMIRSLVIALAVLLVIPQCESFSPPELRRSIVSRTVSSRTTILLSSLNLSSKDDDDADEATSKNPLELGAWYAVEAFGKAFGSKKSTDDNNQRTSGIDFTKDPSSLDETQQRINIDNERSYFLSGEVDRLIYDKDCTFADPFVSFDGRDRFIENLANLGSFITDYSAKMIKYDVEDEGKEVNTKVSS